MLDLAEYDLASARAERQRSMVSKSIEKPRNLSSAGEAAIRPAESAIRTAAAIARRRTGSMYAPRPDDAYSKRSRRLTIGAGPDVAFASIWKVNLWRPILAL